MAQPPIASFENNEIKIPSLVINGKAYKDIVLKHLGEYKFDVASIVDTQKRYIHAASNFRAGILNLNALEVGKAVYADVKFKYLGGTTLSLLDYKGPIRELSFKLTDFLLTEPKEWKTTERVWNGRTFENNRSDQLVSDFPIIDIDRDGRKDLLIVGTKWDLGFVDEAVPLRWLRNTGNGFEPGDSSVFPKSSARWLLRYNHVADFNNDGFDDFFGVDTGYDGPPFPGAPNLLLLSNKIGGFEDVSQANKLFNYRGFTHGLAVGDINNDGSLDIVTSDIGGVDSNANKTSLRVLINDGVGNFTLGTSFQNLSASDGPYYDYGALSLSLIDLNNDSHLDLVVGANEERTKDRIFWGNANGEFATKNYTILPDFLDPSGKLLGTTMVALGTDLDFDGDMDLVISKTNNAYKGKGLQFLLNQGNYIFIDATDFYSPIANSVEIGETDIPYYMKEIDINRDGLLDIKLSYDKQQYYEGGVSKIYSHFWIKQKDGTYEELSTGVLNQKGWIWLIDYDEDGDIDIINRDSKFQQRGGNESYLLDEIYEWRILENKSL